MPALRPTDYRALAGFRYELRRFVHFSEEAARAAGIEPQQHQLLLAVKGLGETPPLISELAERLQLRHNTTVELVDRCEAKGLITRRRSPQDSRAVIVRATPKGLRLLAGLSSEHYRELKTRGPALVRSLQHIIDNAASARRSAGNASARNAAHLPARRSA